MPSLTGLRWKPIVTVLNPTSAMNEEQVTSALNMENKGPISWVGSKRESERQ
jgi:hypothetical protein